jgi:hypothetical protein
METRAPGWGLFPVSLSLLLLSASPAHAQRVPEVVLWSAGASLLAPFVAVPIKLGILRLLALEPGRSRFWSVAAIEWGLWFPVAFFLLRSVRSSSVPLVVLGLFASIVWLHRERLTQESWRSALWLSLPTPVLALSLPFLALAAAAFLESHLA